MAVQPRPDSETIDARLALLEEAFYGASAANADGPPRTQREILAWTTRRFGTVVLAVTAAVSIAAGYVLAPLVFDRGAAPPARAQAHAAAPAVHHVARQHHAAAHAPAHIVRHAAPVHPAVVHATVVRAPVSHPLAVPPAPPAPRVHRHHRHAGTAVTRSALQAQVRAQEAELVRLRALEAREAAAARAAQARARAAAARSEPATVTTTTTVPLPASDPSAGTKAPPPNPNGGWTEHPPLPGPYGSIGPIPIGGTIDPCTPRGGRIGVVLNAILGNTQVGSHIHF